MSLDKSRIPKRGNSSRKFIPEKQRKTMTDPFVDWIKRSRSDKGETVSGRMVETRSQKTSEERKELLEVEVNTDHAMNDNQEVHGLEGRCRRLASESTPVEQGHDFATSTGTLDREEMSELSDISTEIAATRRSPTDNTMMAGGTGKQTTSSSFSERMKNTFGYIFPFTMGRGAGNEGESQEEEDEEEQGDFGSQVSLNSSIQENEAYVGRETGTMDKFGVVTTISKEANTPGQSKDFAIMTSSEPQTGESRTRGLGNASADPKKDKEKTSRQRVKARISTSTKLPGTDRVAPPLVNNGAALEEALNNIVDSLGEQNEQMSIGHDAMMEQDAVHIGYEADVTAHLLDTNGTKIGVTGLLDTGAVVSVMPIKTWERMGFTREDLIPTNLRLAAANRGAIYVAGRTPITVLHMGGRDLWMSFLVVENLDDADQFSLGRDFVRNFGVMIDLNNGLIRIRNPDRKYVKRPINRIITDENKVTNFFG